MLPLRVVSEALCLKHADFDVITSRNQRPDLRQGKMLVFERSELTRGLLSVTHSPTCTG